MLPFDTRKCAAAQVYVAVSVFVRTCRESYVDTLQAILRSFR